MQFTVRGKVFTLLGRLGVQFARLIVGFVDIFIKYPIDILAQFRTPTKCTRIKDDLILLSATKLAEKIRNEEYTSYEVVSNYINRVQEVNGVCNAVVERRFKEALRDAKQVDIMIKSKQYTQQELESKFPLLGLPVTIKNSISVKNMLHLAGRKFKNPESRRAYKDADVVQQVQEAGGIVILTSSCPELCISLESRNKVIGITKNPHDTRRTAGGSSAGEAVLLSTGASLLGIGSDILGSCRIPASYCGIFGHKPTARSVSIEGHYPDCKDRNRWSQYLVIGPMVRYAEDFRLLYRVMAKPDYLNRLKLNQPVDLKKVRVYYMYDNGGCPLTHPVSVEVVANIRRVVKHLETITSFKPVQVSIEVLKMSTRLVLVKMLEVNGIDDILDNDPEKSALLELLKWIFGMSYHTLPAILYVIAKRLFPKGEFVEELVNQMRSEFQTMLKDDGVFIFPTILDTAFYHGQMFSNLFDASYTGIFNILGLPATSFPVCLSSKGLPIGLQVVANADCDRLCFAVAEEMQRKFGGWIAPSFKP